MSFRKYQSHRMLRRLHLVVMYPLKQIFTPTTIENHFILCADLLDTHEQYMISTYKDLIITEMVTGKMRRLRQHTLSSTAGSGMPTAVCSSKHLLEVDQRLSTKWKTNQGSTEQATEEGDSSKSNPFNAIPASTNESDGDLGMVPTEPLAVMVDDDVADDLEGAVILKAKWVKLSRMKPEKVLFPRKNTYGFDR